MNNTTEIKDSNKKDHYHLVINGVILGEWEKSELRHHLECVDNKIHHNEITIESWLKRLRFLTGFVRDKKGPVEALNFYIKYIQPIKGYFKTIIAEENNKNDLI